MGENWFGQFSKSMIKSDLSGIFGSKSVAAFHRQFDLGIEALDDPAGEVSFCRKIVQEQRTVSGQGTGDFFEGIEVASGNFLAPCIEELCCPSWRTVGPKVLESFDQEEGTQGSQGRAFDGTHAVTLTLGPVAALFQKGPAHLFEQRIEASLSAGAGFFTSDVVNGFVELLDDVEAVENVKNIGQEISGTVEVGFPHVGAKEADAATEILAKDLEEEIEGGFGAVVADPEQSLAVVVDLVNQRPEFVLLANMDFIDPESLDSGEIAVLDAVIYDPFDRTIHISPTGTEAPGDLRPRQETSPLGQEEAEHLAVLVLAAGPRHPLDGRSAFAAVNAPWRVDQKDEQSPEGNKVPLAFGLPVISRSPLPASRTNSAIAFAFDDLYPQRVGCGRLPCDRPIDKSLDGMNSPEYTLQRYATHNGWFIGALSGSASLTFSFIGPKAFHPFPQEEGVRGKRGSPVQLSSAPQRHFFQSIVLNFTHRFFQRAVF